MDLSKFEARGVGGELELRLSMGLMLFLTPDFQRHGKQTLALWNDVLGWLGRDVFTWTRLGGGNKSRKMDGAAFRTVESWLGGTKPFGKTCWIDIQGGPWEEIGPYAFTLDGRDASSRRVSGLALRLPPDILAGEPANALAKRLCALAGHLDFLCGTAGFMLHATPFDRQRYWPQMKKLVVRYEGVEPDMLNDGEYTAGLGLTGVNWLTFIGSKYLEVLDGPKAIKAAAAKRKGVTVYDVGKGLALRAGPEPQLGDRNTASTGLAPYRQVYEIVKPALFADAQYPFDDPHFDGDETVTWMHRFGRP
jgi:hypothetical protein